MLIAFVTYGLIDNLFKSIFAGIFVLLFWFSYKNIFKLKNNDTKKFSAKIAAITGFSLGLLAISTLIAGLITDWIEK